jgi:hypothetical protein
MRVNRTLSKATTAEWKRERRTTMTYRPYSLGFARLPRGFNLTLWLVGLAFLIAVALVASKTVPYLKGNGTVQSHLPAVLKYFRWALYFLGGLAIAVVFQAIKNICRMCVQILDRMEIEEKSKRREHPALESFNLTTDNPRTEHHDPLNPSILGLSQ